MIHIVCTRPSTGAQQLRLRLKEQGVACRRFREARHIRHVRTGDLLVCWGEGQPAGLPGGVTVLNPSPVGNKYVELQRLHAAGVVVPEFTRTRPQGVGWLGRSDHHQEGRDLIHPPPHPGFWTRKLEFVSEWRFHIFEGTSIRRAKKIATEGAHPWIRSYNQGWRFSYSAEHMPPKGMRDAARAAVAALRYNFGAVDLGFTTDRRVVVLEVNAAPGLDEESQTLDRYVGAIRRKIEQAGERH